jgi:excisionase family DNA binding protein
MPTAVESPYLTAGEAAAILRATPDYVARQCKAGHIKATNLKGSRGWRILRTDLEAFMAGRVAKTPRPGRTRRAAK